MQHRSISPWTFVRSRAAVALSLLLVLSFSAGDALAASRAGAPQGGADTVEPAARKPVLRTLTVVKAGSGTGLVTSSPAGIDCGSDCSQAYARGTVVTLTAAADANATFTGWSGACTGTGGCVVTLSTNSTVTATFAARSISVASVADAKEYDGTTDSDGTPTLSAGSLEAGDVLVATQSFATAGAGTGVAMLVDAVVIVGPGDVDNTANYVITEVETATGSITAAPLTASATADDKVYDGTTAATIDGCTLSGTVFGTDDVACDTSGASAAFDTAEVGQDKTVTVTGLGLSGADADNYELTATTATTTASIGQADQTITFTQPADLAYGEDQALDASSDSGLAVSFGVSGPCSLSGTTVTATGVGVCSVTASQAGDATYLAADDVVKTFDISARAITVTADAKAKTYGAADPALTYAVTSGSVVAGDLPTGALTRAAGSNAGTYPILVGTLSYGSNYDVTYVGADLTIETKSLTVTVVATSKTYDGTTSSSTSPLVSGLVAGDASTYVQSYASADAGTGIALLLSGSISDGNGGNNYAVTLVEDAATGTIGLKTVTANATAADKNYDGTTSATITGCTLTGVVGAESVSCDTSGASASFANATVGTGKTVSVVGIGLGGADADNYELASTTDTTTATIRDVTAPTFSAALFAALRTGVVLPDATTTSALPVTLTWTAADNANGSGIASYVLERTTNGGVSWTAVASGLLVSPYTTTIASTGTTRFRIRAVDGFGNTSTNSLSGTLTPALVQESAAAVKYTGTGWTTFSSASNSGGTSRYNSTAGRSLTYTFTSRSIAVVALLASSRGQVQIYIDNVLQATVDTYAATATYRSVIWRGSFATSVSRTIKLVVVGTAGRPRFDLDGFVTMNY